jgi:hypothetical protein
MGLHFHAIRRASRDADSRAAGHRHGGARDGAQFTVGAGGGLGSGPGYYEYGYSNAVTVVAVK